MLSDISCSPHEMKILVPVSLYEPSGCGMALVVSWPRSEPQCGSVRSMQPVHSPVASLGRYISFCVSVPCRSSVLMQPRERPGYMPKDQLVVAIDSALMEERDMGRF